MSTKIWEIGLVIVGSIVSATAPMFIKRGMDSIPKFDFLKIIFNINLIIGICIYLVSYVIVLPAFKEGDLSILYPCISIGYIWSSILAVRFLGEKMNTIKWFGVSLIILGVALIGIGR
jgi:drug/metabolite transporter (DMT)-like permease